jgi:hypothetical protein
MATATAMATATTAAQISRQIVKQLVATAAAQISRQIVSGLLRLMVATATAHLLQFVLVWFLLDLWCCWRAHSRRQNQYHEHAYIVLLNHSFSIYKPVYNLYLSFFFVQISVNVVDGGSRDQSRLHVAVVDAHFFLEIAANFVEIE